MIKNLASGLLALLFFITCVSAQVGNIEGTVKTSDGQPAKFVNITIKGTGKGSMSDTAGNYEIKDIKAGNYTLVASFIGLETKEQSIQVTGNETTRTYFVLTEDKKQLDEVIITSSWNKFAQRSSDYVARMPIKPLENAQVYNTITKELAKEQLATDFKSVLKNAPGVAGFSTQNPLGRSQLMIRGFSQIFTLKNGMQVYSNFAPDPVTIEKADIIKGPSATLFGAAAFGMSYGGFVNQQTKRPYESFGGEAGISIGSWNLKRITAEVNTPLNADNTVLFRINTAVTTENGFKDFGYNRSFNINPEFLFKVSDRLTVRAEFDIQNSQSSNVVTTNPVNGNVKAKNWKDLGLNYTSSWIGNDVISPLKYYDAYLSGEYRLSGTWKSQTNVMISSYNNQFDILSINVISDSTLVRNGSFQTPITNLTNIQQNFIGDFNIGKFRNRLLVGADYLAQEGVKENVYTGGFVIDTINYRKVTQKYLSFQQYERAKATQCWPPASL